MSKYFITIEDVALLSGFDGNIDNDSINPFIFMAQRNDIERVLRTNGYMYITYHDTTLKNNDSWGGFSIKVLSLDVKSQLTNNINNDRRYTINTPILREYLKKRKYI